MKKNEFFGVGTWTAVQRLLGLEKDKDRAPPKKDTLELMHFLLPHVREIVSKHAPDYAHMVTLQTVEHSLCEARKWWDTERAGDVSAKFVYTPNGNDDYRQLVRDFTECHSKP